MAFWGQRERVALGFGPDRVRILVARGNGRLKPAFSGAAELPAGAVRAGLRAPGLGAADAVYERLEQLAGEARGKGLLRRRPELVAVLLPDVSVKLATAPVEGEPPGREEAGRMARWALGDLLPGDVEEARIDWTLMTSRDRRAAPEGVEGAGGVETLRWLVALGAERDLVEEYEELVERLGWSVGRLVPWTLALAVGAGREAPDDAGGRGDEPGAEAGAPSQRLLLCEADGTLACLFEAEDVPRFHRAWRAPVPAERIAGELPGLRRYITDRLEMGISESWLCGPDRAWTETAEEACSAAGLRTRAWSPEDALLGGLHG